MPRDLKIVHNETLSVVVRARNAEYYNGKAAAVSSINKKGAFDILPRHTHFITLIQNSVTIYKNDGTTQQFSFSNALLKIKDDLVEIYIGLDK